MADDQVQKIYQLLCEFDTAMLVTYGEGFAHARPMAMAEIEKNCDLWFFTGRGSAKVHEIQEDQSVLIVCQDEHKRYISLAGRAELVADRAKARELWSDSYKTWFPGGVEDPDLLLLCVHADEAEYWDSAGTNGLRYLFQAAKARMSGTQPEIKEGEQHGKVSL